MCGIVGYLGTQVAAPILLEGLARLEYRGYDSAGLAVVADGRLVVRKTAGRVSDLAKLIDQSAPPATLGIAHTRWATHGAPETRNAHPHLDQEEALALVHNGIVENYRELAAWLVRQGHSFRSETDTEVLAHLVGQLVAGGLLPEEAVRQALELVDGACAIAVIDRRFPERLVAARRGSPLIVGTGDDGSYLVASDESALAGWASSIMHLDDGSVVTLQAGRYDVMTLGRQRLTPMMQKVSVTLEEISRGDHPTFMHKEIWEQPQTIADAMAGRLASTDGAVMLGGLDWVRQTLVAAPRLMIAACGTSWHAGLIGEYLLENLAGVPVEVDYASELRSRRMATERGTVCLVISQSGETADTLEALRAAKAHGLTTIGICNTVNSTLARETDAGVYLRAGREIGVASTKAFTSQVTVLVLLTLMLGRERGVISSDEGRGLADALRRLPEWIAEALATEPYVESIAERYMHHDHALFLGRGYSFPVALEGALKLKEISYVHAEGYPAAEMKHGPIALIDEEMPSVVIATNTQDALYQKVLSNIAEIKSRRGKVIAIATRGNEAIRREVDDVVYVPETPDPLSPLVAVIPLQLLAYHIARRRGCDVDRPRNLAKSVTVE